MNELGTRARGKGDVRPGSMTAVMRAAPAPTSGPKWLRWALVEDGRIVREAIHPPDRSLTIGVGGEIASAARTREIVAFVGGRWRVRFEASWRGRLAEGALEALPSLELGDGWREIELGDAGRARIVMGERALLLQLVERPPVRTRPQLPAALSGGFFARADWWFTAFVTGSFLCHFAAVAYLMEADWPVETALIDEARIVSVIFDEVEPPVDPPVMESSESEGEELADATDPAPSDEAGPPRPAPVRSPRRPRVADAQPTLTDPEIAEMRDGVQLMLGSLLGAEGSAVQNLLENGAPTDDAASILETVSGTRVAAAGDPAALTERPGGRVPGPAEGGIGRLAARRTGSERGAREGGALEEVVVTVRPPGIDELDPIGPVVWDPRELHRQLGRRMSAIRRCYEHELTRGTVQGGGRIELTMQVMPVGSLSGVRAQQNTTGSASLADCAVRSVRNVRLLAGPDQPVEVRYPIVFSRQE